MSGAEAAIGEDLRTGDTLTTTQRVLQGAGAVLATPSASKDALAAAETAAKQAGRVAGKAANEATAMADEVARRMTSARLGGGFGQPQLATANNAPVSQVGASANVKGANVLESRANGFPGIRIPSKDGSWDGAVGNSGWKSTKPDVIAATKGKPIPYEKGFPNFSEWSRGEVKIPDMKGNTTTDFKDADELYAIQQKWVKPDGTPDATRVRKMRESDGLTWHHHQDMTTMQLVPQGINNEISHTGGASLVRRGGKSKP